MTDRELALNYCRAQEASMVEALMSTEKEIARRLDIDPVYLQNKRFREEQVEGFVSRALAFNNTHTSTVGVRFVRPPGGFVRPENPFRFVSHEVLVGDVGAMITAGPLPIDPPDGWVVVLVHDLEGKLLCTTLPPGDLEFA